MATNVKTVTVTILDRVFARFTQNFDIVRTFPKGMCPHHVRCIKFSGYQKAVLHRQPQFFHPRFTWHIILFTIT